MKKIYCDLDMSGNVRNNSYLDQQIYNKYGSMIKDMEEVKGFETTYQCEFNKDHKQTQIAFELQNNDIYYLDVYEKCNCNKEYTLIIKEYDCKSQNNVTEARGFKNAQELVDYLIQSQVEIFSREEMDDCLTCGDDRCFVDYKFSIEED